MLGFLILFLISLTSVVAYTTFFDDSTNIFIISSSSSTGSGGSGSSSSSSSSSGSSSGGGGISWSSKKIENCSPQFELIVASIINATIGKNYIDVFIKNIGMCSLENVNISVNTSFAWNKMDKNKTQMPIKPNELRNIRLLLTIPSGVFGDHFATIIVQTHQLEIVKMINISVKSMEEEIISNKESEQSSLTESSTEQIIEVHIFRSIHDYFKLKVLNMLQRIWVALSIIIVLLLFLIFYIRFLKRKKNK